MRAQTAQVVAISLDPTQNLTSGIVSGSHKLPAGLPQLVWADGAPWREANVWLLSRWNAGLEAETLRKDAQLVGAYAKWIEEASLAWHYLPLRKEERVLNRYRQHLLSLRAAGELAASTATHRMRAVISLYRWLADEQLLSAKWPLWEDRAFGVRITTDFGLQRSISVTTSSLAIKNKRHPGYRLEGGVLPVSAILRTQILEWARAHAPTELFLMLACGFFTGMRTGSICDLRIGTLTNAARDSKLNSFVYLAIGPGATPQVHTKFGVTGQVIMPTTLFDELLSYVESPTRLKRVSRAAETDRDRVFLTSAGRSYAAKSPGHGATVSVLMSRLRRDAAKVGIDLGGFHFHQTRATFATEVAETALRSGLRLNAISIVKDLLLHAHEATSLRYIRFVEDEKLKAEIGNDFSRAFLNEAMMPKTYD